MAEQYDVTIAGAGIAGLVCGSYLAQQDLKVLIVEKHHKPGGYCASFRRPPFTFDAAAHSFGAMRQSGIMRKILSDLDVNLAIDKYDPTDLVIAPGHRISFHSDIKKTAQGILDIFPAEHAIERFLTDLLSPSPSLFISFRNSTFKDMLDAYITDEALKALIAFPVLGNGGLPPSLSTAFVGAKVFTETLLDGGYSPSEGMQALSDGLAQRFKEMGGTLLLSTEVKRILLQENKVRGILTEREQYLTERVISCCDARETFLDFLPGVNLPFAEKVKTMTPSFSLFVLYLGVTHWNDLWPQQRINVWKMRTYEVEEIYRSIASEHLLIENYMVHFNPVRMTLTAYLPCPFIGDAFWRHNKTRVVKEFIEVIERDVAAGLRKALAHKEGATPLTLRRYTSNSRGAAYGWEGTQQQFLDRDFKNPAVKGLYLAGHWCTMGTGIPGAAFSAHETAQMVMRNLRGKDRLH